MMEAAQRTSPQSILIPTTNSEISNTTKPEDSGNRTLHSGDNSKRTPPLPQVQATNRTRNTDATDPFFSQFPRTGVFETSAGGKVLEPIYYRDSNLSIVYGTADIAPLRELMRGTGYEPITYEPGDRGLVYFFVGQHEKSDFPDYKEFVVTIAARPVQPDSEKKMIPWVNGYSSIVPVLSGAAGFLYKLTLTDALAVDYGKQKLGMDKVKAPIEYVCDDHGVAFGAVDNHGKKIATGQMQPADTSPAGQLAAATGLAHAFGLKDASQLPPPAQSTIPLITKDVLNPSGPTKTTNLHSVPSPNTTISLFQKNDKIDFGSKSEIGAFFQNIHFIPTAWTQHPHWKLALEPVDQK
ncbi:MAG: hypothetical protein R3C68_04835 [Myxococcota bacterium]